MVSTCGVPRTIDEWVKGFAELYAEPDSKRRPEEFWNASMAHFSAIGEAIRRYDYRELLISASHGFCWMCCYINNCNKTDDLLFKITNSFSEIVGLKFPRKCGHCLESTCCCRAVKIDGESDKSSKYIELYNEWRSQKFEVYTIQGWLELFWKIFNQNIHLLTIENIGFHLLEEAGEHALAIRQLVQFRGVLEAGLEGIDKEFLTKITNIDGLIEEYKVVRENLQKLYSIESKSNPFKKICYHDARPLVIKARIMKAKIDQLIEFADTFSWFCAVILKLNGIIEKEELTEELKKQFNFDNVICNEYKSKSVSEKMLCYACEKDSCICLFYPAEI